MSDNRSSDAQVSDAFMDAANIEAETPITVGASTCGTTREEREELQRKLLSANPDDWNYAIELAPKLLADAERAERLADAIPGHYCNWCSSRWDGISPLCNCGGEYGYWRQPPVPKWAAQRLKTLEQAIDTYRSQKADDRCIEDDDRLYESLGDGIKCDRRVGDKEAMLENCKRFIENRCEGGGWTSYADMKTELDETRRLLKESEAERDQLRNAINAFGNHPEGFDWAVLGRIDELEDERDQLRAGGRDALAKASEDHGGNGESDS